MYRNLSAKYYQENKEKLQKKADERCQILSKEEKKNNMIVNVTKICQKKKSRSFLSIEKNITEWEKNLYYNYKKVF